MFGPSMTACYATRALVCLARHGGWIRGSDYIASCAGIPRPYLIKILHRLAKHGLVATRRGFRGGYGLARNPQAISLYEILCAVDGPGGFDRCLLGLGKCSPSRGCPVHPLWARQRARVKRRYRELTLDELAAFDGWNFQRDYHFGNDGFQSPRGES